MLPLVSSPKGANNVPKGSNQRIRGPFVSIALLHGYFLRPFTMKRTLQHNPKVAGIHCCDKGLLLNLPVTYVIACLPALHGTWYWEVGGGGTQRSMSRPRDRGHVIGHTWPW